MGVHCEGVSGAIAKPPTRLRRGEIPCVRERPAMVGSQAAWSRPSGATQHSCWVERLGGRVCGRAKLLAGTLRCLHLGGLFPLSRFDEEQLGRCPKPHKGRCPLTLQGADEKGRSPPLTLFCAPAWSLFHTTNAPAVFRCRGVSFIPFPYSSGFSTRIIRSITG